jgi:predicted metalloprotease with PDZ domain
MPDPLALHYTVRVVDSALQIVEVDLTVRDNHASSVQLSFSSNAIQTDAPVSRFRIRSATGSSGQPLEILRENGIWRIDGSDEMQIHYEVHLSEGQNKGVYASELLSSCDPGGARFLGSDLFLFPLHAEAGSLDVDYELPPSWELVHPFQTAPTSASYPDLRSLYFSVVAAGEYRTLSRTIGGSELVLAARGDFRFGDPDLMETIARIAQEEIEFFGGSMRPRYVFVVNPHPRGDDRQRLHYFGLHFVASMAILLDPRTDRLSLQAEPAQIIAHEFFHNWNGELIRQEDYEMNWFIEGVTTFYSYKFCQDARMLDGGSLVRELNERYDNHYVSNPKRGEITLAEAGKTVLQNQDTTQLLYSGGMLAALALDIEIGNRTDHQKTLNDIMLDLASRATRDAEWHLTREELRASLADATGTEFEPWLQSYIYGLEPLELPDYIRDVSR